MSAGDDDDAKVGGEEDDRDRAGFLTLHASDPDFTFEDREEDYPESWLNFDAGGEPRLKPNYRQARPKAISVGPVGRVGPGVRAWFLPGKFRLCLRCKETYGGVAKDRTRLASLSAEGRSSATTIRHLIGARREAKAQ